MSILPDDEKSRARLEQQADSILANAHARIARYSEVRDAQGRRLVSLDQGLEDKDLGDGMFVRASTVEEVDAVMDSLEDADLSRDEARVVRAVCEGEIIPGVKGGFDVSEDLLGKTPVNARNRWARAKRKLSEHWAEPVRDPYMRPHSSIEGTGHTVFIGQPRVWGKRVDRMDAAEAMMRYHASEVSDSDWNFQSSMTPDGWQLDDDNYWKDA